MKARSNLSAHCSPSHSHLSHMIAIIVGVQPGRTIIWSLFDGLMHADRVALPLAVWVRYQFSDVASIKSEEYTKKAHSLQEIEPLRISAKLRDTVQVFAKIRLMNSCESRSEFVCACDDVLGNVLCSRDAYLLKRLEDGEEIEIFAVFIEEHMELRSVWFAIAVNTGNETWRKVKKLPSLVHELAENAFEQHIKVDNVDCYKYQRNADFFGDQCLTRVPQRYRLPDGWESSVYLDECKIDQVLALVVDLEEKDRISIMYTRFGLARLQKALAVGTWLKITMQESVVGGCARSAALHYNKCYNVLKNTRIEPPMSTRVIDVKGEHKVLLCGVVYSASQGLDNLILGLVDDPKRRVKMSNRSTLHSPGYLIEMGLFQKTEMQRKLLSWQVMKFHGVAVKDVHWVSLKESVVPDDSADVVVRIEDLKLNGMSKKEFQL